MSANTKHTPILDIEGTPLTASRIAYRCEVSTENANTMAAALDLLAALRGCEDALALAGFQVGDLDGFPVDAVAAARIAARAAIEKAEGGDRG
jgi:hypothetical protein